MYAVHLSSAMSQPKDTPRKRLSRDRVLEAAVALADEIGLKRSACAGSRRNSGSCRWRSTSTSANKDELLDGMVDIVFDEMRFPPRATTGGPR